MRSSETGDAIAPRDPTLGARRRRLAFALQCVALLAPLLFAGYLGGRQLWAAYHSRAAKKAIQNRKFAEAQTHLRHALKVWVRDADVHLLAARTARRAGFMDEAVNLLVECEELPRRPQGLAIEQLLLDAQLGRLGADGEASLWALIRQKDPSTPLVLESLAQFYLYRYQLDRALDCLERWTKIEPDVAHAYLWRGQAMEALANGDYALDSFARAVELDPDLVPARLSLANLLLATNRVDDAAEQFEYLRRSQPDLADPLLGLGRCHYLKGNLDEAERCFQTVADGHPDQWNALRELGRIALDTGRLAAAEKWLRQSEAREPFDRHTLDLLVRCLQLQNKQAEAKDRLVTLKRVDTDLNRLLRLVEIIGSKPADASSRYEAGHICLRYGQATEGVRWLLGALQVDPRHQGAHLALGDYYEKIGKPGLAKQHRDLARAGE